MEPAAKLDKLRVMLLGSGILGYELLGGLLACPAVELVGVIAWSSAPGRHSRDRHEKALIAAARRLGVHIASCSGANTAAFAELLERRQVDCVLVGAWGEIFNRTVLARHDVFFINCHPSLLPAHRGPNPYCSAIRAGETTTGVSFHMMASRIDSGPILAQTTLPIGEDETGGELRTRAAHRARDMVCDLMNQVAANGVRNAIEQSRLGPDSYYGALQPVDALIPWASTGRRILDRIRGVQPWLRPYSVAHTRLGRISILVNRAALKSVPGNPAVPAGTVIDNDGRTIWVASADAGQLVGLVEPRVGLVGTTLGAAISRRLAAALIKPGTRFVSAQTSS